MNIFLGNAPWNKEGSKDGNKENGKKDYKEAIKNPALAVKTFQRLFLTAR